MTELIGGAQKGDVLAFEKLILEYEKSVYNIAYRMFSNSEDAKDIAQEVFIKVFKNIYKYEEKSSFKTWIYTIAYNTCIDEIRRRKGKENESMDKLMEGEEKDFKKQFASKEPTPEEVLVGKEKMTMLVNAINTLGAEHRAVVVLRDIRGLSYDEIAEVTGLSIGTVKSRLSRARQNLRKIITEQSLY